MTLNFHFTLWDIALIAAVTAMSTAIAYLHAPRWKALLLSLPVPFSLITLSLAQTEGRLIEATQVVGLVFLLLYTHGVRWLHCGARMPIVAAILLSAAGYCVGATLLAPVIPRGAAAFWLAAACGLALALGLAFGTQPRDEPGHRSPLPVWIKLPIIAGVIVFLVVIKKLLLGFMALFPMVGLITAYEARHSLWTISRQIPIFMAPMICMMAAIRLAQEPWGIGWALLIGWAVFLAILVPVTLAQHARCGASPKPMDPEGNR